MVALVWKLPKLNMVFRRKQIVKIKGQNTGRKLTRPIITDYPQGLPIANYRLIFLI